MVILSLLTTRIFLDMVVWNDLFSIFLYFIFYFMYFWSNHYHFLISAKIGLSFFSSSSFRCKVSCILEIFLFYQYIFLNFSSYLLIYLNLNIYLFSQLVAISNSKDSPVKVLHSICQQI